MASDDDPDLPYPANAPPSRSIHIPNPAKGPPNRSIHIANVPANTTGADIRDIFEEFGLIQSVSPQISSKVSKGYAFVNFHDTASAIRAVNGCQARPLFGLSPGKVVVTFQKSPSSTCAAQKRECGDQWFERRNVGRSAATPVNAFSPPRAPKSMTREISPPPIRRTSLVKEASLPQNPESRFSPDESKRPPSDVEKSRASKYGLDYWFTREATDVDHEDDASDPNQWEELKALQKQARLLKRSSTKTVSELMTQLVPATVKGSVPEPEHCLANDSGSKTKAQTEEADNISPTRSFSVASLSGLRCADCRNPEEAELPLTGCNLCSRRYHQLCGSPSPCSVDEGTAFICGHCALEGKERQPLTPFSPGEIRPHPQVSPTRQPRPSLDASMRSPTWPSKTNDRPMQTERQSSDYFDRPMQTERQSSDYFDRPMQTERQSADYFDRTRPMSPHSRSRREKAAQVATRYKEVTCARWMKSAPPCKYSKQPERCSFAHYDTGIYVNAPFKPESARGFTCPSWSWYGSCREPERCGFAHSDTGRYLGKDRRLSTRHITCGFWIQGYRCRFSDDECMFAHYDSGQYVGRPAPAEAKDPRLESAVVTAMNPHASAASDSQSHNGSILDDEKAQLRPHTAPWPLMSRKYPSSRVREMSLPESDYFADDVHAGPPKPATKPTQTPLKLGPEIHALAIEQAARVTPAAQESIETPPSTLASEAAAKIPTPAQSPGTVDDNRSVHGEVGTVKALADPASRTESADYGTIIVSATQPVGGSAVPTDQHDISAKAAVTVTPAKRPAPSTSPFISKRRLANPPDGLKKTLSMVREPAKPKSKPTLEDLTQEALRRRSEAEVIFISEQPKAVNTENGVKAASSEKEPDCPMEQEKTDATLKHASPGPDTLPQSPISHALPEAPIEIPAQAEPPDRSLETDPIVEDGWKPASAGGAITTQPSQYCPLNLKKRRIEDEDEPPLREPKKARPERDRGMSPGEILHQDQRAISPAAGFEILSDNGENDGPDDLDEHVAEAFDRASRSDDDSAEVFHHASTGDDDGAEVFHHASTGNHDSAEVFHHESTDEGDDDSAEVFHHASTGENDSVDENEDQHAVHDELVVREDVVQEAVVQPPAHKPVLSGTSHRPTGTEAADGDFDEAAHLQRLRADGVVIEDSSDEEASDIEMDDGAGQPQAHKAAAHLDLTRGRFPVKVSRDLFEVAPSFRPHPQSAAPGSRYLTAGRSVCPPKKKLWKKLASYQCRYRERLFGNPHQMTEAKAEQSIHAIVRESAPQMAHDDVVERPSIFDVAPVVLKKRKVSFADFFGAPRHPVIIRDGAMGDLVFVDKSQLDNETKDSAAYLATLPPTANTSHRPTPFHSPFPETLRVLDEIVTDFIIETCHEAVAHAALARRQKLTINDFKFVLRRDQMKLGRVHEI
ncbi:hypothetical protein DV735_g2580, partial [Chaetothyriales sp. CBS 134920]